MGGQSLIHTFKRYRTLKTHVISALPVVILMPHSACNCRCVMCDIWKDNKNLKQLNESDITGLLSSLKKLGTQQVVMSGGEALLNKNFFKFCEILKKEKISVSLLSTGLTLKNNAQQLINWVSDIVVSMDGDEALHDAIRNIPGAFQKLRDGVAQIRAIDMDYKITGRCVIHRLNFRNWENIISEAKNIGLNQISFLPADVSSEAFNRQTAWTEPKQHEILIPEAELPGLKAILSRIIENHDKFGNGFIAESPAKLLDIYNYYAAFYNLGAFPYKKCNAPWVSTVVEADGSVRPCFFHHVIGNIHNDQLSAIINSHDAIAFRKGLDMGTNPICVKCVCSLNLPPRTSVNLN
jgi:MoaA/NifB/PqqE/SkfB family radical SAM enzyme